MRAPLIAAAVCAALLPGTPALAESTIEVPIQIKNCQSCMVTAQSNQFGAFWDQTVRLRRGLGILRVPSTVTDFQVAVEKGRYYGYDNSAAVIVMAYRGETIGSPISNKRSRTSHGGFMCVPLADGLIIRARAKAVKTPHYKGWRKDLLFKKKYLRVWATPTLPSVPTIGDDLPLATRKGALAVQNTVCGSDSKARGMLLGLTAAL